MIKSAVVVTLRHEATHRWPNCDIDEVAFLKETHRHVFHIKAVKPVGHLDRDIEIIRLKREIIGYLTNKYGMDFGILSCEQIAEELISVFCLLNCEVLEDGENGAYLWKTKD